MRALVKADAAEGLRMEDRPIPEIGPDDVLIKIIKTGICGTDVHIWNWDEWARRTVPVGLIIGHEFVGEVVEIGGDVQDVSIGQRC
ncbi:MAG: alcohol dehydrogenase catalytic domain-containing protein, partial [Actinobacteria bacterium]|nr:alcohol dehydrogenase catalytic domain-containing protein [Actinomycetota bacterium]